MNEMATRQAWKSKRPLMAVKVANARTSEIIPAMAGWQHPESGNLFGLGNWRGETWHPLGPQARAPRIQPKKPLLFAHSANIYKLAKMLWKAHSAPNCCR